MVTSAVVILARISALARPVIDVQIVSLATIAEVGAKGVHAEVRATTVLLPALVHIFTGFMVVLVKKVSCGTATPETALKVLTSV